MENVLALKARLAYSQHHYFCKQYHGVAFNPFLNGVKTLTLTVHVNQALHLRYGFDHLETARKIGIGIC